MSHPISQSPPSPPGATSSVGPLPSTSTSLRAVGDPGVERLRAELAASSEPARQARLLCELGEIEESAGDETAAARDYLAAYEADATFREPLEGLARLIEKRPSLKTLGRLFDALVDVAGSPDEKVRALLMRAAHIADTTGDLGAARTSVREATTISAAAPAEQASAWLTFEILAARTGDTIGRERALAKRTEYAAGDPSWRALLLLSRARMAAAAGEMDAAIALGEEARSLESDATWAATELLEQILGEHGHPGALGRAPSRSRADLHAAALEAIAGFVHIAIVDADKGDALGVPLWVREPGRAVDAWLRAAEGRRALGQIDAAALALNRALFLVDRMSGRDGRIAEAAVAQARIRLAEQTGDTALAAQLAAKRLASETDGLLAAGLALRVAEHAAAEGDPRGAVEALTRAIASDPGCLPARALALDILADVGDGAAFAAQLESLAEHLGTDEARGRAFLLAAYMWAVRGNDPGSARMALTQAQIMGAAAETTARLARMLASIANDATWYEDASRRLLAAGVGEDEEMSLHVELARARDARGDTEGAADVLGELAESARGSWLARAVLAFSPPGAARTRDSQQLEERASEGDDAGDRSRAALAELIAHETNPDWLTSLGVVAALRAHARGDAERARQKLRQLVSHHPEDAVLVSYLGDLERALGDREAAGRVAANAATATTDVELASAWRLESALESWRAGHRRTAVDEMAAGLMDAPESVRTALAWASWGVDPDSLEDRRRALYNGEQGGGNAQALALEWFATEIAAHEPDAAGAALARAESAPDNPIGIAAALGRLLWSGGATSPGALAQALERIEKTGPNAGVFIAIERVRIAREAGDAEGVCAAARAWFEAGGGLAAVLEWLAASVVLGDAREEIRARVAATSVLTGEAGEAMMASAALLRTHIDVDEPPPLVNGRSAAVRLANLELGPPGCDPRRRATVLEELHGSLGDDAAIDARNLAAWSRLAALDFEGARASFEKTTAARPGDVAAWEGLRLSAERTGNGELRARAAAKLGELCQNAPRAAAFWEEAALLWLDLGDGANADVALDASFARDPSRNVAFDRLFRRVRDRKDNAKLLEVIARRLEATDDSVQIQKLYWEQARALRELGEQDAALEALEHVTMIDPDHVGALALLGEINLRRGRFEEAATALARLAALPASPPKNRVTAGVAAVDIYENKLGRFDKALEILLSLHQAKISTLPVRERLARTAARTGSWAEATAILEELMRERPTPAGRVEAARLAIAIHRDRLGDVRGAAAATIALLGEDPSDGEALAALRQQQQPAQVTARLLQAARSALVRRTQEQPTDVSAVQRLAAVAQDLKDDALAQAALASLSALGASDAPVEQAYAQLVAKKPRTPQHALSDAIFRESLAPGDAGPIADLFVALGPTLAEALGPSLQGSGATRRDKIDPRSGLLLRNEIAAWAGAFGVRDFDLYVGGKDPLGIQGIPGEPPALVVGPGVNAPLGPLARARVARELLAIVRGTTVTRWRDDVTIAAIVVAACRFADVKVESPPYAVLAEVEKLMAKALPRKTRKQLPGLCAPIASRASEARAWSKRALASHDRFAAIASGDPTVVLGEVLGTAVDRLGQAVPGNPRAVELLRFVLSPEYLAVRRALGLEGGG
jgi:tetratricopeptide (TPR) repeat protein